MSTASPHIGPAQQPPTLQSIFQEYGEDYREKYRGKLSKIQLKAMDAVEGCRTPNAGFHVDVCDHCGKIVVSALSCKNRHCPRCNAIAQQKWVDRRIEQLLPIPYHHAVFTLPHFFNPFVQYNERLFYELLFEASSQALQTFGRDERWLGAEIGFYGLLHTWGGKMWRHLHIHYIVTAGGLTADGIWIKPRYSSRFLFPVKAMSKVFRAKFIEGLLARHQELLFPKGYQHLSNFTEFVGWLRHSCPLKWVVYSKRPFAGPETVVKYIGRYTHRVAISNGRIHAVCDDYVTFSYKDYQQEGTWAQCRLHIDEFIRRFLTHVLPFRFHKIRHYGFLSNGRAARNIKYILSLIAPENKEVSLTKPLKKEHLRCSSCQKGFMQVFRIISRFGRILYENKDIFPKDGVIDSS